MRWFSLLETLLLVVLGAFALLPYGVSSVALIALAVLSLFRTRIRMDTMVGFVWALLPPAALLVGWTVHMATPGGWPEIQLWAIWIAALIGLTNSRSLRTFNVAFIVFSCIQALVVVGYLVLNVPYYGAGFAQHVRDAIEAGFHWHPTYLSTIWSLAAILTIGKAWSAADGAVFHLGKISVSLTRFRWPVVFILVASAAIAGGKMPILALTVVGFVTAMSSLRGRTRRSALAALILVGAVLVSSPVIRERAEELRHVDMTYAPDQHLSSTELRLGIWKCSAHTFLANFWLGVGTGNTRYALEACYEKYAQEEFFDGEYNSHNQWIHFALCSGIVGGLVLLIFWFMIYRRLKANRDNLGLAMFLFFLLVSLTENYYSRHYGMIIWAIIGVRAFIQQPGSIKPAPDSDSHTGSMPDAN